MELQDKQVTIFSANSQLVGNVSGEGSFEIRGQVIGEMKLMGELIITEEARVEGEIDGITVIILGKMIGDVKGKDNIRLGNLSYVNGNIDTCQLAIEAGARYMGTINMRDLEVRGEISYGNSTW